MAKPNYSFAKRQRELEKKTKKEEKRKNKAETKGDAEDGVAPDNSSESPTEAGSTTGTEV